MSPRAPPANELNALKAPVAPRIPNCLTPLRAPPTDQPITPAPHAMHRDERPRGPFPQLPRGPFPQPQYDVVAYGPAGATGRIVYMSAADSRSWAILPDIRRYCREERGRKLPKEDDRGLRFHNRHVKDECSLCRVENGCPWAEQEEQEKRGAPKEEGDLMPQGPLPATHAQSRLESTVDEDRLPASLEESIRVSQAYKSPRTFHADVNIVSRVRLAVREKLEREKYV